MEESESFWGEDGTEPEGSPDLRPEDETDDDAPPVEVPHEPRISGFWRRLFAFALDGLLLGVVGAALGFALFDTLAHLGAWGRLVGFGIALAYFGILNSAVGKGQTLAKRLFGIHVVDRDGNYISVGTSCVRSAILAAPIFLNQLPIPTTLAITWIGVVLGLIVFGLGGSIVYLYVFNRRTRQSVHDLAAGTFVTRVSPVGAIERSMWRPHLAVVGVWLALTLVSSVATPLFVGRGVLADAMDVIKALEATGQYQTTSVFVGKMWSADGGERDETHYVTADVTLKKAPSDPKAAARDVAQTVMREYPGASQLDSVNVRLVYGYDIGIARAWKAFGGSFAPDEWEQ